MLVGHTEGQAKRGLRKDDYEPKRQHDWSRKKKGTVIHQSPSAGTELDPGHTVTYVVSDGWPHVPRWGSSFLSIGTRVTTARRMLAKEDLKLRRVVSRTAGDYSLYSPGLVYASEPKSGAEVAPGTKVTLFVAAPLHCTPGYSVCLPPHLNGGSLADYDCAGGTGDGPYYAPYTRVWGSDPYGLDDDSDGIGCESS